MEAKLLNYTKTPIPVLMSSPTPNYSIMQSLLSMTSSSSASSTTNALSYHQSSLTSSHLSRTSTVSSSPQRKGGGGGDDGGGSGVGSGRSVMTKKQEKSFIRNTINLINNHSSRTIAKDLVLSAARKQKYANAAKQRLLADQNNSRLGWNLTLTLSLSNFPFLLV